MRILPSRFKVPRSLSVAADMYYTIRQQRYSLQADVTTHKECEASLRTFFIESLPSDNPTVAGQLARVTLIPRTSVKVVDWASLREYIRRYDAFDLLQLRTNEDAVKKLWAEGREVPGTEPGKYYEVSAVKL